MLFESHITVKSPANKETRSILENIAKKHHWKTSEINGDPILGKKTFFYFTSYGETQNDVFLRMKKVCNDLNSEGIEVLREKIEYIVYDTKSNTLIETDHFLLDKIPR